MSLPTLLNDERRKAAGDCHKEQNPCQQQYQARDVNRPSFPDQERIPFRALEKHIHRAAWCDPSLDVRLEDEALDVALAVERHFEDEEAIKRDVSHEADNQLREVAP